MVRKLEPIASYFWCRVERGDPADCWEYRGPFNKDGYGKFYNRTTRRSWLAHREAYSITYGDIPRGLKVLHRCDNPPCVNPRHLFLGTQADNVSDGVRKGRFEGVGIKSAETKRANGKNLGRPTKVTEWQENLIVQARNSGRTWREIAEQLGISSTTAARVFIRTQEKRGRSPYAPTTNLLRYYTGPNRARRGGS
jgi:hypothetical protein